MPSSWSASGERLAEHGPLVAALLAAVAAIPGLTLPFLADDWGLLADAARGSLARTPFGYFRPLTALTYRAELCAWGAHPLFPHLTNLALAAAAAGLLVVVVRRVTGDAPLAACAGILFALHPYHVENCWWIAGRADMLAFLFLLLAFLAYDRWRVTTRRIPAAAMLLFEAALLCKEAAVSFPAVLLLTGMADRNRRAGRRELARGMLPMLAVTIAHFLLLRRAMLGEGSLAQMKGTAPRWAGNLFAFIAGSVIPLHTEFLEGRPFFYGSLALAPISLALLSIIRSRRRMPARFAPASLAFLILVAPSLLSFQERYLYLPSAASAVALASLSRAMPSRRRGFLWAGLMAIWLGSLGWHALAWSDSGRASERLIRGLKSASMRPEAKEILVINMPHRVHGVALAANFQEAVVLSGGRRLPIRAITALDFPSGEDDGLAGGLAEAVRATPSGVEVHLDIPSRRFSRIVLPPPGGLIAARGDAWEVSFEDAQSLVVRHPSGPGRDAYLWSEGRLRPLEVPGL